MVLNKDSVADHDVSEGSNGKRHQPVPGDEKRQEEGVQEAEDGGVQDAPGRLDEGGVDAGNNVEDTVADNQEVKPCFLLAKDTKPGPEVDNKGDRCDRHVCKKENPSSDYIDLDKIC